MAHEHGHGHHHHKSHDEAAAKPAVVGDPVQYCPNDRETYRGKVAELKDDGTVVIEFTNAAGNAEKVSVPHKSAAKILAYGPHWVEEPQ